MALKRTQILLEEEQYELAKREAARRDISLSELVRKAMDKMLNIKKDEAPAAVLKRMAENAVSGLPKDLSTNDDYLYGKEEE